MFESSLFSGCWCWHLCNNSRRASKSTGAHEHCSKKKNHGRQEKNRRRINENLEKRNGGLRMLILVLKCDWKLGASEGSAHVPQPGAWPLDSICLRLCSKLFKLWILQKMFTFDALNSRAIWLTYILMLFLNFLDNLLWDANIIFQKCVDNFEIEHKTC